MQDFRDGEKKRRADTDVKVDRKEILKKNQKISPKFNNDLDNISIPRRKTEKMKPTKKSIDTGIPAESEF